MDKQLAEKYGQRMKPIPATRVFSKPLKGFKIEAVSWMLINDNTNKVTYVNTFNDKPGKKWNAEKTTHDIDKNKLEKKCKIYTERKIDDCPVAQQAKSQNTQSETKAETKAEEKPEAVDVADVIEATAESA